MKYQEHGGRSFVWGDEHKDLDLAIATLGPDARPTGRMRMVATPSQGRFQQEWVGRYGVTWLDVPVIEVNVLPPETEGLRTRRDTE